MTEESPRGNDFLAHVCDVWEAETAPAEEAGIRVMRARMGVVLTPKGGALAKMLPVFRFGLGSKLGNGQQRMSWIALRDVVALFELALEDDRYSGPVNVVAPDIVTNAQFTKALAKSLGKHPFFLPVPAVVLKLMLGEMAEATLLADLAVKPARLEEMGHVFRAGSLEKAL